MTTVYPLYDTYGNYLDGYYTRDYNGLIEYLLKTHEPKGYKINLGIVDGVTVINNLHGDYSGYNCAIIEREDGTRDLYKITDKHFVRKDIWNITFVLDVFSKYYLQTTISDILVNRLGIDRSEFNPLLFIEEDFTLTQKKVGQTNIVPVSEIDGTHIEHLFGYLMIWNNNEYSGFTYTATAGTTFAEADYFCNNKDEWMQGVYYDTKWVGFKGPFVFLTKLERQANHDFRDSWFSAIDLHIDENDSITYATRSTTYYFVNRRTNSYDTGYTISGPLQYYEDIEFVDERNNKDSIDTLVTAAFGGYAVKPWQTSDLSTNKEDTYYTGMSISVFENGIQSFLTTISNTTGTTTTYEPELQAYNNKILKDEDTNKYYRISVTQENSNNTTRQLTKDDLETLQLCLGGSNRIYNLNNDDNDGPTLTINNPLYKISTSYIGEDTPAVSTTITAMENTIDQPYTVIFIPMGVNGVKTSSKSYNYNGTLAMDFIDYCIKNFSGDSAKLLDVQLCSMDILNLNQNIAKDNILDLTQKNTSISSYQIVDNSTSTTSGTDCFILMRVNECDGLNFNYSITKEISDYKLEQQNRYILRSPSGANSYEFSIAKNMGLNGFKMKWNIRPYGSMYQVQPIYNDQGLYGSNYTDDRGLVSLEDTSLTMYSSAWETYKRQNVNYANSFNEGQSFERSQLALTQKQQWQEFGVQAAGSAVSGLVDTAGDVASLGAAGNFFGVSTGKEQGMVGGAGVVGAAADIGFGAWQLGQQQKHQRQQLTMSQKHDRQQWNYSLGNIKALPNNMSKISGIYNTNTRFFYLEEYNPTSIETQTYQTYLDLFGIKIGYSLQLNQYTFDYIEGNIIKFASIITNEEYEELQQELQSGRRLYTWEEEE